MGNKHGSHVASFRWVVGGVGRVGAERWMSRRTRTLPLIASTRRPVMSVGCDRLSIIHRPPRSRWPPIVCLLFGCGPSAILRLVVAVVVDAVDRQPRLAVTHIGKEICKYVPPIADGYPASSVIHEPPAGWAVATLKHAMPD